MFIIADDVVVFPESAAGRAVESVPMPAPSPAALFECILGFVADDGLTGVPAVEPQMAAMLARGFMGQPLRHVRLALRMCALEHGRIDERALELAEEERSALVEQVPGLSYLPANRLPGCNEIALETSAGAGLDRWLALVQAASSQAAVEPRRRLVVTGPPGSGRTSLALHVAARLRRPVVTMDPGLCLRGGLGETETNLRYLLAQVESLGSVVLVLDNLDRIFLAPANPGHQRAVAQLESDMARLSGRLRLWLERVPAPLLAVITFKDLKGVEMVKDLQWLPTEWKRVLKEDLHIPLAPPVPAGKT